MKKLLIAFAAVWLTACSQIDTGNIGVESTLGQVKHETLPPGVYFTMFKRVTEVSAKELLLQFDDMKPQTSDKITLADLDVDIYVQIDPAKAADILTRWPGDLTYEKGEDGYRIGMNYVRRQAREAIYNTKIHSSFHPPHKCRKAGGGVTKGRHHIELRSYLLKN